MGSCFSSPDDDTTGKAQLNPKNQRSSTSAASVSHSEASTKQLKGGDRFQNKRVSSCSDGGFLGCCCVFCVALSSGLHCLRATGISKEFSSCYFLFHTSVMWSFSCSLSNHDMVPFALGKVMDDV
eukprot:jgi/Mesen1/8566/ME000494S07953